MKSSFTFNCHDFMYNQENRTLDIKHTNGDYYPVINSSGVVLELWFVNDVNTISAINKIAKLFEGLIK